MPRGDDLIEMKPSVPGGGLLARWTWLETGLNLDLTAKCC
jgi:hypothetical protein